MELNVFPSAFQPTFVKMSLVVISFLFGFSIKIGEVEIVKKYVSYQVRKIAHSRLVAKTKKWWSTIKIASIHSQPKPRKKTSSSFPLRV